MINLQASDDIHTDVFGPRFVHDTEQGDNILVLILTNELGDNANVVQTTLSVRNAHDTGQEVDRAVLAGVVVTVLGTGKSVKVEVDANTVLAGPLERLENILPGDTLEEGLVVVLLDGPEGDGKTDPVETSTSNRGKVLLGLYKPDGKGRSN